MTPKEAYNKICNKYNSKPFVVSCSEYPEFYGFFLGPEGTKEGEPVFVGGSMICVNKESGNVERIPVEKLPHIRPKRIPKEEFKEEA